MKALLAVKAGPATVAEHDLDPDRSYVVGRARDADIVVAHPSVSRGHFRLTHVPPGKWLISDLGSSNGTLVNRRRITTEALASGDTIRIGLITLEFRIVGEDSAAPPPPASMPAESPAQAGPPAPASGALCPAVTPAPQAPAPLPARAMGRLAERLLLFGAKGLAGLALATAIGYLVLTSWRSPEAGRKAQETPTPARPAPPPRVRKPPRVGAVVKAIKPDAAKDFTPLHLAVIEGRREAAQPLLDKGSDPNARSALGTPLHLAAANNDVLMALLLLDRGSKVGERDLQGRTPLHLAAVHGAAEAAEFLLDNGAAATVWASDGLTPLHLAAANGHIRVINVLLAAGADPNQPNSFGHRTPLHEAAAEGQRAAVEVLLAKGANVNARTSTLTGGGSTPLHEAARAGHAEIVRLLLSRGADPAARNSDGRTAHDEALEASHKAVADILAATPGATTKGAAQKGGS